MAESVCKLAGQSKLSVTYVSIDSLKPNRQNPRTHSKHQIRQIGNSIEAFGFLVPMVVTAAFVIIAGYARWLAARLLGLQEVPVVLVEHLTGDQIRAFVIADNKLATNAGWDLEILASEFQFLLSLDYADFDPVITGFEVPEIDLILKGSSLESREDPADILPDESSEAVTRTGDMWQLHKHYVLCGSAIEDDSYTHLLGKKRAGVVFTDPPYNVPIDGNAGGNGKIHHREFVMAAGEMSEEQFTRFLGSCFALLVRYSAPGSVHYVCMDWRHQGEMLSAGRLSYDRLLNVCVWVKNNGGLGSWYRSRHELVFVFRNGEKKHRNNVQLGKFGRNRSNVWEYPSIAGTAKGGAEGNLLALHPTVKPVELIKDALLDCSARGEIVLDPFLGSGSTLIAAERTGRVCYGIELDPLYVDTAVRRWQRFTGDHAIHVDSGKRFNEIERERKEEKRG